MKPEIIFMTIPKNRSMMEIVRNQMGDTTPYDIETYNDDNNFEISVKMNASLTITLDISMEECDDNYKMMRIRKFRDYYDEGEYGVMYLKGK
jgi:hypothetical protein